MKDQEATPILIARADEMLRQERETFDQKKNHEERWFRLRLTMGYASIALLAAIMAVCTFILFNASTFSAGVVTAAGSALFVDVLGLLLGVWKIALNPNFMATLSPVTKAKLPTSDETVADEAPNPSN